MKHSFLLPLAFVLIPSFAFASHHRCNEPITLREVLSVSSAFTSNVCEERLPLELVRGPYTFSFGTYMTEYWQGGYRRPAERTELVRYNKYDCWGRLLDTQTVTQKTPFDVPFDLVNLNLNDNSTWADVIAPMTDDEAIAAFATAKLDCESATLDRK